jgi:paired amphipathic helix protein Sin3a
METICNRDIVRYRRLAERHVGLDDHLYRVEWVSAELAELLSLRSDRSGAAQLGQTKSMRIQLVGTEDPSVEEDKSAIGRWREYVDTYTMQQPTEWLPKGGSEGGGIPLFLRRWGF